MEHLNLEKQRLNNSYKKAYEETELLYQENLILEEQINKFQGQLINLEKENEDVLSKVTHEKQELKPKLEFLAKSDTKALLCDINYDKCIQYRNFYYYLTFLNYFEDLFLKLKSALIVKSFEQSLYYHSNLLMLTNQMHKQTKCYNLDSYLCNKVNFWFNTYLEKTSEEIIEQLGYFNWPFISQECDIDYIPENEKNQAALNKVALVIKCLINTKVPSFHDEYKQADKSYVNLPVLEILPLDKINMILIPLILPFYKRFTYHFSGIKKTNQLNKPEWYFGQLLDWLKLNSPFLTFVLQGVIEQIGEELDIQLEFIKGFVYLAKNKITTDLPAIINDESTFSHLIDEAINFQKSIILYGYDISTPSCMEPFCEAPYFNKWINIEQTSTSEKINKFICSSRAWDCGTLLNNENVGMENLVTTTNLDDSHENPNDVITISKNQKLPDFVNKFLLLMEFYNDRYDYLPYPLPKIQFLSLQIELIDDFRIRLLQIIKERSLDGSNIDDILRLQLVPFCLLVNSLKALAETLDQWQNNSNFILLAYLKKMYKAYNKMTTTHRNSLRRTKNSASDLGAADVKLNYSGTELNVEEQLSTDLPQPPQKDEENSGEDFYRYVLSLQGNNWDSIAIVSQAATNTRDAEEEVKVFAESIDLYNVTFEESLYHLTDCLFAIWVLKFKPYRSQNWNLFPPKSVLANHRELSNAACDVLGPMREIMYVVKKTLDPDIFKLFWVKLSARLDSYIFTKILSFNRFNDGGIAQITFDFKKGFFSLFSNYEIIPETIFKRSSDALFVLNFNRGTSLLLVENLRDLLQDAIDIKNKREDHLGFSSESEENENIDPLPVTKSLQDLGVKNLNGHQVLQLISNRMF